MFAVFAEFDLETAGYETELGVVDHIFGGALGPRENPMSSESFRPGLRTGFIRHGACHGIGRRRDIRPPRAAPGS